MAEARLSVAGLAGLAGACGGHGRCAEPPGRFTAEFTAPWT
ncbi:hypothetical protein OHA98_24855 [Streptomyces sp. NBC_00654]|nr:hypothetical protein [Streptomyces sp. NBC_00654]MCX4967935.1 hypothetical protein [Streptomyces sp. NBC_00654]